MRATNLEQLFLRRRSGVIEALLVLESTAGRRERLTLTTSSADELEAVRFVARHLQRSGSGLAPRLRVRRERGQALEDAPDLAAALATMLGGAR